MNSFGQLSFLSSLGDDELLEFIHQLSQERKAPSHTHPTLALFPPPNPPSTPPPPEAPVSLASISLEVAPIATRGLSTDDEGLTDIDGEGVQPEGLASSTPVATSMTQGSLELAQRGPVVGMVNEPADDPVDRLRLAEANPVAVNPRDFDAYHTYYADKEAAQQECDRLYREWARERQGGSPPPLFANCIIYVNGYTKPGIAEIHRLVVVHGGAFIHHLGAKGAATHIIASRLTPKKMVEFQRYKVVSPDWITTSVMKGVLQPWREYSVINAEYGQRQLPLTRRLDAVNEKEPISVSRSEEPEPSPQDSPQPQPQPQPLLSSPQPQPQPLLSSPQPQPQPLLPSPQPSLPSPLPPRSSPVPPQPSLDSPRQLRLVGLEKPAKGAERVMDATHPEYLRHFFANSRLHHLSTWKAELRAHFIKRVLDLSQGAVERTRVPSRVILHVDFDCFFAAVSALRCPEVGPETPVCVTHGGHSADVASCNYAARKYGVKNGMWMKRVRELCPAVVVLDYDFPGYERVSAQFFNLLLALGAQSVFPVSIDEALVDVSNLLEPHGDPAPAVEALCRTIQARVMAATQCRVSVGAASNVLLAKLCLRRAKPAGIFVLLPPSVAEIERFLGDIEVGELPGIGSKITRKLALMLAPHPCTVSSLQTLSKTTLGGAFGMKTGTKLYEYARGIDATSIDIAANPEEFARKSVSVDVNYGIRFETMQHVDSFLTRVAGEVHTRLVKLGLAGHHLTLRLAERAKDAPVVTPKFLGLGKVEFVSKLSRLGVATNEPGLLSAECKALYRMLAVKPADLRGVAVTVTRLVEMSAVVPDNQRTLGFARKGSSPLQPLPEPQSRALPRPLARSVDKVPTGGSTGPPPPVTCRGQSEPPSSIHTQYDIPSEVDSSILQALPSSLRQTIEAKRKRRLDAATAQGIDWSVYEALPPEIKREVDGELHRRGLHPHLRRPRVASPSASPPAIQQRLPLRMGPAQRAVLLRSPSRASSPKKRRLTARQPLLKRSKLVGLTEPIDEDVFNELPSFIREEILRDLEEAPPWRPQRDVLVEANPPRRAAECVLDASFSTPPAFQSLTNTFEIAEMVRGWITGTITEEVFPHAKDFTIFVAYIRKLLAQRKLPRCLHYYQLAKETVASLKRCTSSPVGVAVAEEWLLLLDTMKEVLDVYCEAHGLIYT